ncbi:hypothetical protein ACFVVM_22135 [Nocardia sp. NPDC058176]|uniref:hypothetical protein n=1 Tax=Nocardia sp. NPDC058176 TaxID=3346368 RepID=UPI0036DC92BE
MNYPQGPPRVPRTQGPPGSTIPVYALLAGLGAISGGVLGLIGVVSGFGRLSHLRASDTTYSGLEEQDRALLRLRSEHEELAALVEFGTSAVFMVLLGMGGVLLLRRWAAGHTMVIIGTALGVCAGAGFATTSRHVGTGLIFGMAAVGILIMAMLPSTRRWVGTGPTRAVIGPSNPGSSVPPYN